MKETGILSDEQIASLKKAHKIDHVHEISVQVSDEELAFCYLRTPDRNTMGAVMAIGRNNPIKANEIVLSKCWLAGDERIRTDDELFLSVMPRLNELVDLRKADIKKK